MKWLSFTNKVNFTIPYVYVCKAKLLIFLYILTFTDSIWKYVGYIYKSWLDKQMTIDKRRAFVIDLRVSRYVVNVKYYSIIEIVVPNN